MRGLWQDREGKVAKVESSLPMRKTTLLGTLAKGSGWMAAATLLASSVAVHAGNVVVPGYLKRQYYPGATRATVANGTATLGFVELITSAQAPSDVADNYAQRLSGVFKPAQSGKYVFWVASDDDSDLYLSTDDSPANKRLIAQQPSWGGTKEWTTAENGGQTDSPLATQKSSATWSPDSGKTTPFAAGIDLVAGKSYYIEGIMHEGGGGDNFGFTAALLGNTPTNGDDTTLTSAVIGALVANPTKLNIATQPANAKVTELSTASFSVVLDTDAELLSYQWLKNGQPISGATSSSLNVLTSLSDNGAKYSVRVATVNYPGLASFTTTSAEATLTVDAAIEVAGSLKREYFPGGTRDSVANGTAGTPSISLINGFEAPRDAADNYAQRVSGFFSPPVTGLYAFVVASDDDSDLYVSTDDKPANKRLVAQQPSWGNPLEWQTAQNGQTDGVNVTQKNSLYWSPDGGNTTPFANGISLQAGKKYYIEGIMHEGGGGDNFAATFHLITEATPENGTASAFSGNAVSVKVPKATIAITTQPAAASAVEGRVATFSVAADVTGIVGPSFQWKKNGVNIDGATSSTYKTPLTALSDNGAKFSVVVTAPGASATSADATLTVVPDTFPPAIVSAGAVRNAAGSFDVGVVFDESVNPSTITAGNFTISGGSVSAATHIPNSSTYKSLEQGAVLTVSGLTAGSTYTLTVKNVKDIKGNTIASATAQVTVQKLTFAALGNTDPALPSSAIAVGADGVNVQAGGNAFWNATDDVSFVYEQVTGDFDKVVQIEEQDASSNWARAGLMVRETLDTDSRYQAVHAPDNKKWDGSGSNNAYETNRRLTAGGATDSSGAGGTPRYPGMTYMRLLRTEDVIHMFRSSDGITWTQLGRTDFTANEGSPLPNTMYVGIVYGPENGNISPESDRKVWTAKFRGYGDLKPTAQRGTATYAVGLNFGASENTGILGRGEIAGVPAAAQGNWNNLLGNSSEATGAVSGLAAESNGNRVNTPITVEWAGSGNTWASTGRGEENNKFIGSDASLMTGYLDTGNSTTTTVTISGVPSQLTSGKYDVVVYALGGVADRGGAYRLLDANQNVLSGYQTILSPANPSAYTQLVVPNETTPAYGTYILFKGVSASSVIVEATTANGFGQSGTPRAPINAIQLVAPSGLVKPPSTTVVITTPPAGLTGGTFSNVVIDEVNKTITADVPAGSSQGYLTLSPARVIKSVELVGGKLIIKY